MEKIKNDFSLIQPFIDGLMPTQTLTVSEWADRYRWLDSISSAEPGRWRTDRAPYLRKIMDVCSPSSLYTDIRIMKSSQLGFTEAMLNVVGCYMDIEPCPIMYIMPTVGMAKGFSKSRVAPMITSCPTIASKIKPAHERDANNTVLEKLYVGGILVLSGANSAAELSSRPVRVIVFDEIDRYPRDVDGEGSPIAIASKRALTFSETKKLIKFGTPTISGMSVTEDEIQNTDQQKWHVRLKCCPDIYQALEFENLVWEEGKPETVAYRCPHCGELTYEREKTEFLSTGKWIATKPENTSYDTIGFVINGLYSPYGWLYWHDIVREYEEVKDKPIKLRTFWNTVLGRPYAIQAEVPDYKRLYDNNRLDYQPGTINNSIGFLTAGFDVQKDRIEGEVVGWCRNKISYSIEYVVFYGDTSNSDTWKQLKNFLDKKYVRENGTTIQISLTAIDSGYNQNAVYSFCKSYKSRRVIPVKGQDRQTSIIRAPQAVEITKSGRKIGSVKLFNVGSSIIKEELYGWLRLERTGEELPEGYCFFPQYSEEYFRGLTAEALEETTDRNNYTRFSWVKRYARNEPLDCRVYARAAAELAGLGRLTDKDWTDLEARAIERPVAVSVAQDSNGETEVKMQPLKKKKAKKKRGDYSDFWD